MLDKYNREIKYVRISVTDKCNLRCEYCMPGDIEHLPMSEILSFEEICESVRCMAELGIKNGEKVKVISRRGEITATARVGRKVSQGETWMPFHFPDSPANVLTNAALDDFARIPEYKVCAVRVEKIEE